MAQEAWRAYLELALGATEATRKKATKTVKRLAGKSAISADQLQAMAEDVLRTSSANRDALTKLVRYELDRALGKVGLATADDVGALTARVRELEEKLRAEAVVPSPVVPAAVVPAAVAAPPTKIARKAVKKAAPVVDTGTLASLADAAPAGDTVPGVDTLDTPGSSEPAVPPRKITPRKRPAPVKVAEEPPAVAIKKVAAAGKNSPAKSTPVKRTPPRRATS